MPNLKNKFRVLKKSRLQVTGVLLLMLLAVFLLCFNRANSIQASNAVAAQVYFEGEYRIADGEWQPIEEGTHISSTKGDVLLRGNFHLLSPGGEYIGLFSNDVPIAFYTDHISLTFYEVGRKPYVIDHENPLIGDSACGVYWTAHMFMRGSTEPIEILVHNPHRFGNENAIDEMLSNVAIWGNMDFEKGVLESGATQRNVGILLMLVSLVFLGTALFSTLIHVKNSKLIWLLGGLILFAGVYFAYSARGVSFWSERVISNTTILGCSMMFYMLFFSMIIVCFLKETKKMGNVTVILLSAANAVFLILPIVSDVPFYDTWFFWAVVQIIANISFMICLVREFLSLKNQWRWLYIGAFLPLFAFDLDVLGTISGFGQGGLVSQYVFIALFTMAVIIVIKLIPNNLNASAKAKELELEKVLLNAQLAESRISTMMSQIRPHFIYNTLGSIEQLCDLDPKKAGELVHDFAKYLRGNFRELDNPRPIPMSREMEHVHHYVSIENIRFPDMTFSFEMNSEDFNIPALTIQPIVENAIKHGLMKLQKGGMIRVVSYDTDTHHCVSVVDDGVGFDTSVLIDERQHVGLRNIRERLKTMVGGSLEIDSMVGAGTKVLIKIPKEEQK